MNKCNTRSVFSLLLALALIVNGIPLPVVFASETGIPADAIKIHGEDAKSGNIGNDPNGQEGMYSWIDHHSATSSVTYDVYVDSSGLYNFAFIYTAGTVGAPRDRQLAVDLNGQSKAGTIIMPDTGTWQTWKTAYLILELQSGNNTLTLRAESAGNGICLDYFYIWKATELPTITSIRLTETSYLLKIGQSLQALVEATLSNNSISIINSNITYSTSDEAIVSIDEHGIITGLSEGTATITAELEGLSASASVTVYTPGFRVDLGNLYRPVTHVASGMLYGLAEEGRPVDELIAPIKPKNFTQMAPGGGQLPNGETAPVGDALIVAPIAKRHGATVTIRLPDIYPNFPYRWVSWDDWLSKVESIAQARLASGADNIYAYELWNEPNWTWDTANAGDFLQGWERTYDHIKQLDPDTKIMGPSISLYDEGYLRNFLTYCKANDCLPDIISWHELGDPEPEGNHRDKPGTPYIVRHLASYRALEQELGIDPLPISINEYGVQIEEAVPGNMVQYFAQFERGGVDTANVAFWFRPGRLSNLITELGEPNGGWWLFKWYGDMSGMMAMTEPASKSFTLGLDGIASIDEEQQTARIVFGGGSGDTVITITGVDEHAFFGDQVRVKLQATPWYGVDTAVEEPYDLFEGDLDVQDGRIEVPVDGMRPAWGYNLVITPVSAEPFTQTDNIPVRYEAEDAASNRANAFYGSYASEGRYIGQIDFADSYVEFGGVMAEAAGAYQLEIGYANGTGAVSTHHLTINGADAGVIQYAPTGGWINAVPNFGYRKTTTVNVMLEQGANTIRFTKGDGYAELDYIRIVGSTHEVVVESVQLDEVDASLIVGEQVKLTASIEPQEATNKQLLWSVANLEDEGSPRAVIDANGLLTALAPGKVKVTVVSRSNADASDSVVLTIAKGRELLVDVADRYRPATHLASGSLYGLAEEGRPSDALIGPTRPYMFTQMAPGGGQLPNGETAPTGDALVVAPIAKRHGAKITIRMPDMYPNFPYQWVSWDDWEQKVEGIVGDWLASGYDNLYAYELWNEPDWTWDVNRAGSFLEGWKRTYNLVRSLDPSGPIMGPSYSIFNEAWMTDFLSYCKLNDCLPDIISWHELGDYAGTPNPQNIGKRIAKYREIERELGIEPLPISINEYMSYSEDTIPGQTILYIAQFERHGVESANTAFWFRPGRLSNIITDSGAANGSWWMFKWYGDMSGLMVKTTPPRTLAMGLDGIASHDGATAETHVIFGGESGNHAVVVTGLDSVSAYQGQVHVRVEATPWYGVDTAIEQPMIVYEGLFDIRDNRIRVPIDNMNKVWAYHLLIKPVDAGAGLTRYESERAALHQAAQMLSEHASNGGFVRLDKGSQVEFQVHVPQAGSYHLDLRYANDAAGEREIVLNVNQEETIMIPLPGTEGSLLEGASAVLRTTVQLHAGNNMIRLAPSQQDSVIDIDYIQLGRKTRFELRAEAEQAEIHDALIFGGSYASDARYVGYINNPGSYVQYRVNVPADGNYLLEIGYANGTDADSSHLLTVNGQNLGQVTYPPSGGWTNAYANRGNRKQVSMELELQAGENIIRLAKGDGFAELDYILLMALEEDEAEPNPNEPGNPGTGGSEPAEGGAKDSLETDTGTIAYHDQDGRRVAEITVDSSKLEEWLREAEQGSILVLNIPDPVDAVIGKFSVETLLQLASKGIDLELRSNVAVYKLPVQAIDMEGLADLAGGLQDVEVVIEMAESSDETLQRLQDAAKGDALRIIVLPIDFRISVAAGEKAAELTDFTTYVERFLFLPEGTEWRDKSLAAVVIEPDGTIRPVPTRIEVADGRIAVRIMSRSNSTYSVVERSLSFRDIAGHWAEATIRDMSARLIASGVDGKRFAPDQSITRAEFVQMLVRALGLEQPARSISFSDVHSSDWYSPAVQTAVYYGLAEGAGDGTFRPHEIITREQAMVMTARAMKLIGLADRLTDYETAHVLAPYTDKGNISTWALSGIGDLIHAGIVKGRADWRIAPQESMTRAEAAVMIHRLLVYSDLI